MCACMEGACAMQLGFLLVLSDSEAQGKEELFSQLNMELKVREGRERWC